MELTGEAKVKVQVKGISKNKYCKRGVPCIIWQRLDQYLFWLQRLINIHAVSSQGVPTKLQTLLEKYAETVF